MYVVAGPSDANCITLAVADPVAYCPTIVVSTKLNNGSDNHINTVVMEKMSKVRYEGTAIVAGGVGVGGGVVTMEEVWFVSGFGNGSGDGVRGCCMLVLVFVCMVVVVVVSDMSNKSVDNDGLSSVSSSVGKETELNRHSNCGRAREKVGR